MMNIIEDQCNIKKVGLLERERMDLFTGARREATKGGCKPSQWPHLHGHGTLRIGFSVVDCRGSIGHAESSQCGRCLFWEHTRIDGRAERGMAIYLQVESIWSLSE